MHRCTEAGTWSHQLPFCKRACSFPTVPEVSLSFHISQEPEELTLSVLTQTQRAMPAVPKVLFSSLSHLTSTVPEASKWKINNQCVFCVCKQEHENSSIPMKLFSKLFRVESSPPSSSSTTWATESAWSAGTGCLPSAPRRLSATRGGSGPPTSHLALTTESSRLLLHYHRLTTLRVVDWWS